MGLGFSIARFPRYLEKHKVLIYLGGTLFYLLSAGLFIYYYIWGVLTLRKPGSGKSAPRKSTWKLLFLLFSYFSFACIGFGLIWVLDKYWVSLVSLPRTPNSLSYPSRRNVFWSLLCCLLCFNCGFGREVWDLECKYRLSAFSVPLSDSNLNLIVRLNYLPLVSYRLDYNIDVL